MKQPNATNLFVDHTLMLQWKVPPCARFEVLREVFRIRHFDCLTLKMEKLFTSETSVSVYQPRPLYILEDLNFLGVLRYSS